MRIKSRRIRFVGLASRYGEMRKAYKILLGTPRDKTRWEIYMWVRG